VINKTPTAIVEPVAERNGGSPLQSTSPGLTSNDPPIATAPFYDVPPPGPETTTSSQVPAPVEYSPQLSQSTGRLHDNVSSLLEGPTSRQTEEVGVAGVEIPLTYEPSLHQRLAEQTGQTSYERAESDHGTSSTVIASSGLGDQSTEMIQKRDTDTQTGFGSAGESEAAPHSTPAPTRRTKADLPVFTSSSPIPFGRSTLGNLNENLQTTVVQDASQDGPTQTLTPVNTNPTMESSAKAVLTEPDKQFKIGSDVSEASGPSRASEASIWDIPETPQR
jgi:hypothetical protein